MNVAILLREGAFSFVGGAVLGVGLPLGINARGAYPQPYASVSDAQPHGWEKFCTAPLKR